MARKKNKKDFHVTIHRDVIETLSPILGQDIIKLLYVAAIRSRDVENFRKLNAHFPLIKVKADTIKFIFDKTESGIVDSINNTETHAIIDEIRSIEIFEVDGKPYSVNGLVKKRKSFDTKTFLKIKSQVPRIIFNKKSKYELPEQDIDHQEVDLFQGMYDLQPLILGEEVQDLDLLRRSLNKLYSYVNNKKKKDENVDLKDAINKFISCLNMGVRSNGSHVIDDYIIKYLTAASQNESDQKFLNVSYVASIYTSIYVRSVERCEYEYAFKMAKEAMGFLQENEENLELICKENIRNNWEVALKLCGHNISESGDGINGQLSQLHAASSSKEKKSCIDNINEMLSNIECSWHKNSTKLLIMLLNKSSISKNTQDQVLLQIKEDLSLYSTNYDSLDSDQISKAMYSRIVIAIFFDEDMNEAQNIFAEWLGDDKIKLHNLIDIFSNVFFMQFRLKYSKSIGQEFYKIYEMLSQNFKEITHSTVPYLKLFEIITFIDQGDHGKALSNLNLIKTWDHDGGRIKQIEHIGHIYYLTNLWQERDFRLAREYLEDKSLNILDKADSDFILILIEELEAELENHGDTECELNISDAEPTVMSFDEAFDEQSAQQLTPKQIHQYFQRLKSRNIEGLSDGVCSDIKILPSWIIDDHPYHVDQDTVYKLSDNKNIYATIGNKISNILEVSALQAFQSAISKGMVNRKEGENGIKFINKSFFELKINGNDRLYTNTVYKNPDGDWLIIFDKCGNHNDVARAIHRSKKLITKDVESVLLDGSVFGFGSVDDSSDSEGVTICDTSVETDYQLPLAGEPGNEDIETA